ncbi:MAG: AMIN domain-containing protein [Alphaproteobacteria bacterium]|nr:AMIN domain-containing protein [Alphaproteobacteria bacterium]
MGKIVVIHHGSDGASAGLLMLALGALGLSSIELCEPEDRPRRRSRVESELASASALVVLWSEQSRLCPRFIDLARAAVRTGTALSVRGPGAAPPEEFSEPAALLIEDWDGHDLAHPGLHAVANALAGRVGATITPVAPAASDGDEMPAYMRPTPSYGRGKLEHVIEAAPPRAAVARSDQILTVAEAAPVAAAAQNAETAVYPRRTIPRPAPRAARTHSRVGVAGRSVAGAVAGAMCGFASALLASPLAGSFGPDAGSPDRRALTPNADVEANAADAHWRASRAAVVTSAAREAAPVHAALADTLELSAQNGVTRLAFTVGAGAPSPHAFFLEGPNRFVVDLPRTDWPRQGQGEGVGLATRYRYANQPDGSARLVLDLSESARLISARVENGGRRFVFDLASQAPALAPPVGALGAQQTHLFGPADRLIVIDAGHGGRDGGAAGPEGVHEKDLTLSAALGLRDALVARGYRVELTRGEDTFVSLDARAQFVRQRGADLFISLHADAEPMAQARGVVVYTHHASGRDAAADWRGQTLSIASRPEHAAQDSARFAQLALDNIGAAGAPVLQSAPRRADFVVLRGIDTPAVLVEMGFLSEAEDLRRLADPAAQAGLTQGLARAVDAYFTAPEEAAPAMHCAALIGCRDAERWETPGPATHVSFLGAGLVR